MSLVIPPPLTLGLVVGVIALVSAVAGFLAPERLSQLGAAGGILRSARIPMAVVGAVLVMSTALGATPESGLLNPVSRTVGSVAMGEGLYQASCAACHGVDVRGGGPQAGTTPMWPPALTGPGSHLGEHADGDLHYWIVNGMPGGMPAWAGTLSDEDIWHLVNFLRAVNGAEVAP